MAENKASTTRTSKTGPSGSKKTPGGKPGSKSSKTDDKNLKVPDQDKIRFSIRLKFSLLIGILVILVSGGLSTFFIITQVDNLKHNQRAMATRELIVLSQSAAFGIVEGDPLRILDSYNSLRPVEDVLY